MADIDNENPDLLAEHRQFFIGDMPDDRRDALAVELGQDRAYVDALIDRMAATWDALDQAPD